MRRKKGIPKIRASMTKTTRGKSNVDTKLGKEIERQSEAECTNAVRMTSGHTLWSERETS